MGARLWNYLFVVGVFFILTFSCNKDDDNIYNKDAGTFTDSRDGHVYRWIKIGNQVWMAENLAYLPVVSPPAVGSTVEPHYYVYGYSGINLAESKQCETYTTFGVLYNWPAAKAACPQGWHLPTDDEWKKLEIELGMTQDEADADRCRGTDQGEKMKATSMWNNNGMGTNTSGFSAIPGGYRYKPSNFFDSGSIGYWWSSTEGIADNVYFREINSLESCIGRYSNNKEYGFSVRCIRD